MNRLTVKTKSVILGAMAKVNFHIGMVKYIIQALLMTYMDVSFITNLNTTFTDRNPMTIHTVMLMLILIIDASHLTMSVDHPKKMMVNHVNATANHPRTNMNLLPVNIMNQVMKNLIVMEDSFIMKIWMCIAIHHLLHLSNKSSNSSTGLAIVAATTTMSYNVDQGVYVSSDKEEEETDKKDPGVNVSCDEPSISSSEEEEEISIPLCFIYFEYF